MSVLELAIGWLAPPECLGCGSEGMTLCQGCQLVEILPFGERCFGCLKLSPGGKACQACRAQDSPNYVWVVSDYEKIAKDMIQKLKFAHQRIAAGPMASLMSQTFMKYNSQSRAASKNYLIVPVPTTTKRVRERSFDHTQLLAQKISSQLNVQQKPLLRRLDQSRQVGAKRYVRTRQLKDKFYASEPGLINGRNVLLIDDVVTTGSTLQEAARTLRGAGARSVDALVFAKKL